MVILMLEEMYLAFMEGVSGVSAATITKLSTTERSSGLRSFYVFYYY